ncbi:MAG: hypothetical protein HXS47_01125 [Theionarchaea archaeon]|nr:hypothetical protein [Theionarchaea archaeon]
MYAEKLKQSIGGVIGSFTLRNGTITESDLHGELQFVTQSILYVIEAVQDRKPLKKLIFFGDKKNLYVYTHPPYTIGVLLSLSANIHLLNLMIKRILETPDVAESSPAEFLDTIPYLYRSLDELLPNVPSYSREVLKHIDGKRTIREIIELSSLPANEVLDIILTYRKSSELLYRE